MKGSVNSKEQPSENKRSDHAVKNAKPDFDEQVMRSVVGRGALAEIGSTKDLIDEFRGPVELP